MKNQQLTNLFLNGGCSEVGFSKIPDEFKTELLNSYNGTQKLNYAITLVVKLSSSVLESIDDEPTHVYFHHYRTVNTLLDNLMLQGGILIEKSGYRYVPVAASQSIKPFEGLFQHKTAARLAGLGAIGKSGLFISKKFGSGVRLGTILTDMPLDTGTEFTEDLCKNCDICVKKCPAMAISGESFDLKNPNNIVDAAACSQYMKTKFQHIGRGVVCGICIKNCPYTFRNNG